MALSPRDQRKYERETEAYKMFTRVAKKIQRLEYGKWTIVPDLADPMRKIILEKDIGWCTLKVRVSLDQTYHRGDYSDNRYDWRGVIGIYGLHHNGKADIYMDTTIRVRPRMAKKLLTIINEKVIPGFYADVESTKQAWEEERNRKAIFEDKLSIIEGLKVDNNKGGRYYNEPNGELKGCPLGLWVSDDSIRIQGEMNFEQFASMAKTMGWGK